MNVLASPCWYDALTLKERLVGLRSSPAATSRNEAAERRASERLEGWRHQAPFAQGDFFARRLAADHMTEDELSRLLGESADVVRSRVAAPPAWLELLQRAFASAPLGERRDEPPSFVEVARPLLAQASTRLRNALRHLAANRSVPFEIDAAVGMLTDQLGAKLAHVIGRTLALELNVARLQGTLEGDSPEQRFRSFLVQLRRPERALALLSEYPVMARQVVRTIDYAVAAHLEFLERLSGDWDAIRGELHADGDPGKLQEVTGGVGDSHRKGRSVLIARFESGFKIVYKPRPLSLDRHFQQLLAWLGERGAAPAFRSLAIVDRESYGWVEFIEPRTCATPAEVERFYRRQGAYLALLYALDATDFHTDNLVAHGEHPVLLDLEALFHNRPATAPIEDPGERAVTTCLQGSVLRIGLLPQRTWGNDESDGVDLSGLGSIADQLTPSAVPHWQKLGTDEMHLGRERVPIPIGNNRPTLQGRDVDLAEHANAIAAGFADMYRLLERHRAELVAPEGPLAPFADDEVRVILRATQTYSALLRESYHPDVLRDELERTRLLDRLWVQVQEHPHLARVTPAEVADLAEGDIPMFTTRPDSRDLATSSGECIPAFFEEPAMVQVRRRVASLGVDDLERQLWFVRASLATAAGRPTTSPAATAGRAVGTPRNDDLLAAARAIGDELERRSLQADGTAIWLGLANTGNRSWTIAPLGPELYDGLAGTAMFLAYLGAITDEQRYRDLARGALRTMRAEMAHVPEGCAIGAFTGLAGVAYALTHVGAALRDEALHDEARATIARLSPHIGKDEHLDVIAGSAGCIGALLSVHRHLGYDEALTVARRCGDRLIATARPIDRGVGWVTPIAPATPLSGFSHGAAGMAWALLRLFEATGEERYRGCALDAIAYERALFSPAHGNWLDLREAQDGDAGAVAKADCATTWCHGAAGIGLARLGTLSLLDDSAVREEIDAARAAVVREGFGTNHSLCHGDLGNLELLAAAAEALGDPSGRLTVRRIACGILDDIQSNGWKGGNPLGVDCPGLMTGLAGIGYGLLRLAAPERVPSVLLLEAPRAD